MVDKPESSRSKQKWDRLALTWKDAGPPASPSKQDIDNYRSLLVNSLEARVNAYILILGCTPELRMIFGQGEFARYEITCVDISKRMYERTTEALRHPMLRERFVESDWVSMDLGASVFDAILGDKVIDNVMPVARQQFFRNVYRHLRLGGSFITRLGPQNLSLRDVSFFAALSKWSVRLERGECSIGGAASGLWEEMLGASAFRGNVRYTTQKIARFEPDVEEVMRQSSQLSLYQREVLAEFLRLFWGSRDDEWASYDFDQIIYEMSEYFSLEETVYSHDYAAGGLQPIIRLNTVESTAVEGQNGSKPFL